jgi:uncharacterized phage-associated protein
MGEGPPWNPKAMANLFLDWFDQRRQRITPLKLQKCLYFCHADYLQNTGVPLVSEEFEAWRYGPVLPSVFQAFKHYAGQEIDGRATRFDPATLASTCPVATLDSEQYSVLREIFDLYAPVDGGYLSSVSHRPGGPWSEALRLFDDHRNINRRISNDLIAARHKPIAH